MQTPDGSQNRPDSGDVSSESGSSESSAPSEAGSVYLRWKAVFGDGTVPRRRGAASARRRNRTAPGEDPTEPFGPGRDPRGLGTALAQLSTQLGWQSPLAQSELLASWARIAGEETSRHSSPAGITDGILTVRCESTAWATQLRLMRVDIMSAIAAAFPDAGITGVRFLGPDAPSWKRGPRSIPGRGPRDTYG
jgi:predicted nucleic acid-binding Zn ribbon protein